MWILNSRKSCDASSRGGFLNTPTRLLFCASVSALLVLVGSVMAQSRLQRGSLAGASEALFIRNGGRVAWYHGRKHDLIAYDSISDTHTRNTELYTINPDAT